MLNDDAISKLRRLMEARVKRDEAKVAAEAAERDYREIEAEVWEELDQNPIQGVVKVDLGEPYGVVSFQGKETYYGRVIDPDKAIEGFEQRAIVDEYTQPKIVMARINEEVRDRIEQGQPMPPGIDFYAKRFVAITRQKG